MDVISNIVNRTKQRLKTDACLHIACKWMCIASVGVLFISVADRFVAMPLLSLQLVAYILLGALIGVTLTAWFSVNVSTMVAATELDKRFELKDRVATSLTVEGTPFAEVVVQDAIESIRHSDVQRNLNQKFPIHTPQSSLWLVVLITSTFIVLNTGQWNFFNESNLGMIPDSPDVNQIEESIQQIVAQIEENQLVSDNLEKELNDLQLLSEHHMDSAEEFQHEALRKITDIQKRLDEMLNSEELLALDSLQNKLKQLELPRDRATLPLVAALKNGDFDDAQKEFEKLEKQLQSDSMSEEERESLREALEELAQQLDALSEMNSELASALSSAGLQGSLSDNLDAAKKAVEQSKTLNEEQKKKLLEMIKQQQMTKQMCQQLSSNCKKCAGGQQNSESELAKLNAMQMFKTEAQLSKSQCQGAGAGMCNKPGMSKGTGGQGQGNGGANNIEETEFATVAERAPVYSEDGPIIASQLFNGGLLTAGESKAELREAVLHAREEAEQAITEEQVPRKYHDLLRHYFGQLEKLTESEGGN